MRILAVIIGIFLAFPAMSRADLCAARFNSPGVTYSPMIIVLSAPSGGGKTTLAHLLIEDFPELTLSVSSTTRAPRGTEKDGVDYHFLSVPEFKKRIADGQFAEYAEVHGNYYGTDVGVIKNEFGKGHSVLALVDIEGAKKLRAAFPGQIYTVFLTPPDMATLEARLRSRGTDSEEAIQLRLKNAKTEMAAAPQFDEVVVNDVLDTAHSQLEQTLEKLGLTAGQE